MFVQLCEYALEKSLNGTFKWVNWMVYELYLIDVFY